MPEARFFVRIELTTSAKERADHAGLDVNSATQVLDADVQIGDRISFGSDAADDFIVIRRRHLIGTSSATLVLVLDHPARD